MARDRATVFLTLWNDPDFRTLTTDAQWLYQTMLTHPTLAYTGVMDWHERRLCALNTDMTITRLRRAAWELGQRRMIVVDTSTGEALVRSFVRHDGVLKSPNVAKGMVRQHASIASLRIMELVSREARRAAEEDPSMKGIQAAGPVLKQFPEPIAEGFVYVPEGFRNPSDLVPEGFESGSDHDPESVNQSGRNPSELVPTVLPPTTYTLTTFGEEAPADAEATPRRRATRLPSDFTVTDRMREWAERKCPHVDIDLATEKFVNYWTAASGKSATKLDWPATWRNWLLSDQERASRASPGGPGAAPRVATGTQRAMQAAQIGRELQAQHDAQHTPREISA